jgi:hypothetical protein
MKSYFIGKCFSGYGHNRITMMYRNGKEYSTVTSNTILTDEWQSDNDVIKRRAARQLMRIIKRARNLR